VFYRYNQAGEIEIITENRIPNHKGEPTAKLPGGGLKKGENIFEAIKREIKEELGFDLAKIGFQFIGDVKFELTDMLDLSKNLPNQYAKSTVFMCHYPVNDLPDAPNGDDIDYFEWLPIADFRKRSRRNSYLQALDLIEQKLTSVKFINCLESTNSYLRKIISILVKFINHIKYTV
jgi:8-oxo-dGTP pyrophosphatase MutT (NUDIX family)